MPSGQILYIAIAVLAGVAVPFLAAISAAFGQSVGNVHVASMTLCVVAFAVILAVALLAGTSVLELSILKEASWWHFSAGFFFAVYVVSITFVAPKIGLANAIILVVVAQMFTAVVIDHFGWFGAAIQPLGWKRILGLALLVAGVALAKSPTAGANSIP